MTTTASIGYGSKFAMGDGASPEVFTNLAMVTNITPPKASFDVIDVTSMDSPDQTREFISGLNDPGECSIEMNFEPGSDSDVAIQAAFGLRKTYRITFPNDVTWTFAAMVTGYEPSAAMDAAMKATVTFKVTGSTIAGTAA